MAVIAYTDKEGPGELRPGEHEVSLLKWEWACVKTGDMAGESMLKAVFKTKEGNWVYDNLIFHERQAHRVSAMLRAYGIVASAGQQIDVNDEMLEKLRSRSIRVEVGWEEYTRKDTGEKVRKPGVKRYLARVQGGGGGGGVQYSTKVAAWQHWQGVAKQAGMSEDRMVELWKEAAGRVMAGRTVDQMTAEDWNTLGLAAAGAISQPEKTDSIPF